MPVRVKLSPDDVYSTKSRSRLTEICPDQPAISADMAVSILRIYIIAFITKWNALAEVKDNQLQFVTDIDQNDLLRTGASPEGKRLAWHLTRDRGPEADGYALFRDKLDVIQDLLAALRDDPRHINFIAETQWGKTIVMMMVRLFWVLYNQSRGNSDHACLVFLPNKTDPTNVSKSDYLHALAIHGLLRLKSHPKFDVELAAKEHSSLTGSSDFFFSKNIRGLRNFEPLLEEAAKRNIRNVTILIDESDEAPRKDSVFDRMLEVAKKYGIVARLILITATPWPHKALDFVIIEPTIAVDGGYCGTLKGQQTPLRSMTEFSNLLGFPDLTLLHPKLMKSALDYMQLTHSEPDATIPKPLRRIPKDKLPKNHAAYKKLCANALLNVFVALANNRTARGDMISKFGPFYGGKGGILRLPSDELAIRDIVSDIERSLPPNIELIRYYGKSRPKRSNAIREDINAAIACGNFYIIVVMAQGRRMDRMGKPFTTFGLDLTETFATVTAAEQGTLGRLSGWHMITDTRTSMVVLSDDNTDFIRMYRELYAQYGIKVPLKRAAEATYIVDNEGEPISRFEVGNFWEWKMTQKIDSTGPRKIVETIRAELEDAFRGTLRIRPTKDGQAEKNFYVLKTRPDDEWLAKHNADNSRWSEEDERFYFPIYKILSEERMDALAPWLQTFSTGLRLLRPEHGVVNGRHLTDFRSDENVMVSVGSADRDSWQNTRRFKDGIRPELHFRQDPTTLEFRLHSIRLPLYTQTTFYDIAAFKKKLRCSSHQKEFMVKIS
jgi:hypothetical protein